jgi:hypothetical protein
MTKTERKPSFWRKAVRAMGGSSLLMQDRIDELRTERDQFKAELDDLRARPERAHPDFDLQAHVLLRDVLAMIHEHSCYGDYQEALYRLWMHLDKEKVPVAHQVADEDRLLVERVQEDHYVSSYCTHGLMYGSLDDHRRCRLRCKDHAHPCRCPCHRDGRGKPIPEMAEAGAP